MHNSRIEFDDSQIDCRQTQFSELLLFFSVISSNMALV